MMHSCGVTEWMFSEHGVGGDLGHANDRIASPSMTLCEEED
jgi:hypothetical protein